MFCKMGKNIFWLLTKWVYGCIMLNIENISIKYDKYENYELQKRRLVIMKILFFVAAGGLTRCRISFDC